MHRKITLENGHIHIGQGPYQSLQEVKKANREMKQMCETGVIIPNNICELCYHDKSTALTCNRDDCKTSHQ